MKTSEMWLVCETNPWPDNYIALFCTDRNVEEKKPGYSRHTNIHYALCRARFLRLKYGVKQIRLFYPNSVSIIVKLKKNSLNDIKKLRSRNN